MNLKITPSKDALASAFRTLLQKKPFSKISIEEITTAAGLSRQTFYRNFYDKYDALSYLYAKDTMPTIEEYGNDIRSVAVGVLAYFKEHDYIYKEIGCDFSVPNAFLTFWVQYNFDYMALHIGKRKMNKEVDLALRMFVHGCYYIHYQYMMNNIKGSPEEIGQLIIDNMPDILKPYFQL